MTDSYGGGDLLRVSNPGRETPIDEEPSYGSGEQAVEEGEDSEEEEEEGTGVIVVASTTSIPPSIDKELSDLVNYCRAMGRFKSFEEADRRDLSCELHSISEGKGTQLLQRASAQLVQHNRRQITRLFPRPSRVDSSNYVPQAFWNAGCQMVALNFQTLDLAMQLNLGMFERNGRCGYVLKPESMRRRDRHFYPMELDTVENIVANTLTIEIISGQMLSTLSEKGSKVTTSVDVEMFGLCHDTVRKRFKTRSVPSNGINPVYWESNAKAFHFPKIIFPELATLRIIVNDDQNRMLAHRILPVVGLRPGYRHVVLRNSANQPCSLASLFVKISVRDYVPETHKEFAEALENPIRYAEAQKKNAEMLQQLLAEDERERPRENGSGEEAVGVGVAENAPSKASPSIPERVGGVVESEAMVSTTSAPGSLALVSARKASSGLPGAQLLLDSYQVALPSLQTLDGDKKISKLRKSHEEEMERLAQRQHKEREKIHRKLTGEKRKSFALINRAKARISGSHSQNDVTGSESSSPSKRNGEARSSLKEARQDAPSSSSDTHRRQWLHIQETQLRHVEEVLRARLKQVESRTRSANLALSAAYAKDVEGLMRTSKERRVAELEELTRRNPSARDFIAKSRKEIEARSVAGTVEARKALQAARDSKEEKIRSADSALREAATEDFNQKQVEIREEIEQRIKKGDPVPDTFTSVSRL